MKAIIVGGGKIGYYLLKALKDKYFDVVLIEQNKELCDKIAEELDAEIICGDGSDIDVLEDAGIEEAEIIAAVTGKDEENLVVCQMAKLNFNIKNTIARINNPKNRAIFKALGVDKTVCSTEVIANLIEGEFASQRFNIVQTIERGKGLIVETIVQENFICCNKTVSELKLPDECVIVSLIRNDKILFPRGNATILSGDKMLIITNAEKKLDVENAVIGGEHNA